ncbi:AMP deaminase [Entamoeba marina]
MSQGTPSTLNLHFSKKLESLADKERLATPVEIQRSIFTLNDDDKTAAQLILEAKEIRSEMLSVPITNINEKLSKSYSSNFNVFLYQAHHDINDELLPKDNKWVINSENGLFNVYNENQESITYILSFQEFMKKFTYILSICDNSHVKKFTNQRIQELEKKYSLFKNLNLSCIKENTKNNKDVHSLAMVDTSIVASASMTESSLISFIKSKLLSLSEKNKIVYHTIENGKCNNETLTDVIQRVGVDVNCLTLNSTAVGSNAEFFNRFDNFNKSYEIGGTKELRRIFLKTDNDLDGQYFAELLNEMFERIKETPNIKQENRISVYGKAMDEWEKVALWRSKNNVNSPQNKFLIQFPRTYHLTRNGRKGFTFEMYLDNIFLPLFQASNDPIKYKSLAEFLNVISGFDSVDDESVIESLTGDLPPPSQWDSDSNPPYHYYIYHFYANIKALNIYRLSRNMNTFDFRPHSGEAGHISHLVAAYLTAKCVSNGVNLMLSTPLQYLYYLDQIGVSMSPLSNHCLCVHYDDSPFYNLYKSGLNISLSTSDPLQFHRTQNPLLEEYVLAIQTWSINDFEVAELCRNSVIQSGFTIKEKEEMIGKGYWDIQNNDSTLTKVSTFQLEYRQNSLKKEFDLIRALVQGTKNTMFTKEEASSIRFIQSNYIQPEEVNVIRKLMYWMIVRKQYLRLSQKISSGGTNKSQLSLSPKRNIIPLTPHSESISFGIHKGVFNMFDSVCEIDQVHVAKLYCFDCAKSYCVDCYKKEHQKRQHVARQIAIVPHYAVFKLRQFIHDLYGLQRFAIGGVARSFSYRRLVVKSELFGLHKLLNSGIEDAQVSGHTTDFERVIKVDSSIDARRSFHPVDLLDFIKNKLENEPNRIVFKHFNHNNVDYTNVTLKQLFEILDIKNLSLHNLGVQADPSLIKRFDLWSERFNPFGYQQLNKLFLSLQNDINGEYLCELIKTTVIKRCKPTPIKLQFRIQTSASSIDEIENMAKVIVGNRLLDEECCVFVIQLVRDFESVIKSGSVENFEELLINFFKPLFDATLHPNKHPQLNAFLSNVGGFDIYGDERVYETDMQEKKSCLSQRLDQTKESTIQLLVIFHVCKYSCIKYS